MKQRWRKLGLVYCPSGEQEWLRSHASVPIAEHIEGDTFRIYFSSRNQRNESHTAYVVVDLKDPRRILDLSLSPTLSPGELGGFDDSGAMATWLATHNGRKYLYYIGWNLGVTVPFRNSIGLAVSQDDGSFKRYAQGPIVDRTSEEPHFVASCCVLPSVDRWRMWYLSCTGWMMRAGKPEHRYHIKYAESVDGIHWQRAGVVAIDYVDEHEYAISRPSVVRDNDLWRMWFSCRGSAYRIGYAESHDGITWRRFDAKLGLGVSASGWDSDMVEYPFVFDHGGARYMLYNGNGYGRTGFGLAVLE